MEDNGRMTLDEIAGEYEIILFDSCAFHPLGAQKSEDANPGKRREINMNLMKESIGFCGSFLEGICSGKGIFISKGIYDEIKDSLDRGGIYISKLDRKIEQYGGLHGGNGDDDHKGGEIVEDVQPINLFRIRRDEIEGKIRLLQELLDRDRIIDLSEEVGSLNSGGITQGERDNYNMDIDFYVHLKETFKLSIPDYSLLITGLALSQRRGRTAILSNDFGILYSWNYILCREDLDPGEFGFFSRLEDLRYSRAKIFRRS